MKTSGRHPVERAQRFSLKIPMSYQASGMLDWHEGRTVNISSTGILFRAEGRLEPDARVNIRVHFPSKVVLACQATVVRAEKSACAVRFRRYSILRPDNPPIPAH